MAPCPRRVFCHEAQVQPCAGGCSAQEAWGHPLGEDEGDPPVAASHRGDFPGASAGTGVEGASALAEGQAAGPPGHGASVLQREGLGLSLSQTA